MTEPRCTAWTVGPLLTDDAEAIAPMHVCDLFLGHELPHLSLPLQREWP